MPIFSPRLYQSGTVTLTFPGGAASFSGTITFPVAFNIAPAGLFLAGGLINLVTPTFSIGTPSTTSCTFLIVKRDASTIGAGSYVLSWFAA